MRGRAVLLAFPLLVLTACEKDFDEKYQENLEQLNEDAREIEAHVDQQLAEGREADTVLESEEDGQQRTEARSEAAQ
ncbi:hypothetical protein [Parasphingorhabdus sp.]|uniref:hypothetical protein n=1 Tax=Parasphingorhabdus sp. TaxID=2709688 RepID=UPI0035941153